MKAKFVVKKEMSMEERMADIRESFREQFNPNTGNMMEVSASSNEFYIQKTHYDYVLVSNNWDSDEVWKVPYTVKTVDGESTHVFAPKSEWVKGKMEFVVETAPVVGVDATGIG